MDYSPPEVFDLEWEKRFRPSSTIYSIHGAIARLQEIERLLKRHGDNLSPEDSRSIENSAIEMVASFASSEIDDGGQALKYHNSRAKVAVLRLENMELNERLDITVERAKQLTALVNTYKNDSWIGRTAHSIAVHAADHYREYLLAQIEIDPRYNEPSTIDGLSGKRQELILANWPTLKDLALASRLEFFAVHGIGAALFDKVVKHFVSHNMFCHIGMRERSSMYVSKPYTSGPYGYISTPEVRRINKCDIYSWKLPKGIISSPDKMSFVLSIGSMYSKDSLEINLLDETVPQSEPKKSLIASHLFESHKWVKNYQDYNAVFCCTNDINNFFEDVAIRCFQTYHWIYVKSESGDLNFNHSEFVVSVFFDGVVVAINYHDAVDSDNLRMACSDLFRSLSALGWVNTLIYCEFEKSALFLTNMIEAIPAHIKLNIKIAESIKNS